MSDVKICSMNCRGLGDYQKRRDVLHYLRKLECNIFLLQDVHCQKGKELYYRNAWGNDILISSYTNNARGVAILWKSVALKVLDKIVHDEGNYIIAKILIDNYLSFVIANVYGPNEDCPEYWAEIWEMCERLADQTSPIIIAGDFNLVLDQKMDTVNYARAHNVRARNRLKIIMQENDLVDVFRKRNPFLCRYTWGRKNPLQQARLDFFLVSDTIDLLIQNTEIVPGYRTDHCMVKLSINPRPGRGGG